MFHPYLPSNFDTNSIKSELNYHAENIDSHLNTTIQQQQQQNHVHHQQQHHHQFLTSSVLSSPPLSLHSPNTATSFTSLPIASMQQHLQSCYANNPTTALRSTSETTTLNGAQLMLPSNNDENFYSSLSHAANNITHHNHGLLQGFHDASSSSRFNSYSSSYTPQSIANSASNNNTSVNGTNSAAEFYRNVDTAAAAAAAFAAVSNSTNHYNTGAFLRYVRQPAKQELVCKWIDQEKLKICNKVFTRMEDIGKLDAFIFYEFSLIVSFNNNYYY